MFETREQYQAELSKLQTPEDQEKFIQEYGDGSDLPTEAEKAITRVETPEEAAQPVIPVTEDSPVPDFIPEEAEPATEEEIEQYANYVKEEKIESHLAAIERNIQARKEQYAVRDREGNIVYGPDGEPIEREVSTGEMMLNSINNMVNDTQSGLANLGVGVNEVVQRIVGDEALEQWAEDADSDFLRAFTDEGTEELIRQAELAESERDEHTGTYTGEDSNKLAAFVNSVTSIGSSAVINTMTLGGGLPAMFMGDFYRSYNEEIAKEKGKSLTQLREDGEDSFWAPAAFGIVAGISERFGLKGAGKAITDKIKGPLAKKVVHRLLSGNKEGLTELFQTGLELANTAHARGESPADAFVEGITSQDGLEAYLQGFTGGATLAGKGQNHKENIKKINRAVQAMRAPVDTKRIDELTAKGVELRQALSRTTDPEAKKLIQDQINETTKSLKQVIPVANGIVRKMSDPQIEKANKLWEQMDQVNKQKQSLLDKFKAGEITIESYKPAREALDTKAAKITEQTSKLKDQAEQQPNLREKDMETPSPSGVWHTSVKGKIDELASDKSNVWDILQNKDVKKFVEGKVRQQWNKIPDDIKAQTTFEDVVGDVMFGGSQKSQSLLGLLQSYDAEGKAKASTYVLKPLEQKILGVIQDQTGQKKGRGFESKIEEPTDEGHGIQVEDTDTSIDTVLETESQKKDVNAPVVANRLGFSPNIAEAAKAEAQQFVENNQQFEGDKKLEQNASKFFRDKLKNQIQKEMGKKDDYFRYLTNNAEQLIKSLPKKALALRRDESQAWAQKPPTPQEFVQYMRSGNETKKKRALAELLADTIGLRAAKDFIESNPELATQVANEQQQEAKVAANEIQEVNEPGSFYTQFQDSTQIAEDDFAAQNKATDKVLEDNKLGKTIDTKNNEQFEEGRTWVSETLTKYFPKEFFQQGMFANAGTSAQKRGFFFTSVQELDEATQAAKSDPKSVWNKTGRYVYGSKDLNNIKKNWNKIQENNKNNWAAFENMWTTFEKMFADDRNNARFISAILKSAQNSQNHISRTAAGLVAYSKSKGKHARYEEEHSLPQSAVSRYLMQTMIEGGDMNQALANVKRNFFQVALNKDDDSKLKKPGEYNYASKMPDGWKMSDNTWARYFNANVNANNGGIDPNSITFFDTGKTVAETFGAGVPKRIGAEFAVPTGKRNAAGGFDFDGGFGKRVGAEFRFNPVVKAQQEVVTEKVGDQVEQNFDKVINSLNKLLGERGALHTNFAHIPVHILIGGVRAAKLAYRGGRDLVKAIDAGYRAMKQWMSREEANEFFKKAVKEVKNTPTGKTIGLQWATENAIKLQQQADLNGKFNEIIEQKTKGKIKADQVFDKGDIGKPKRLGFVRSFFNHPSAEDLNGLLYTILPSGKAGDQAMQFFKEHLITPYQRGVTQMNAYKANLHEGFRLASKLASNRKLNRTVPGTNHSWNNAARVALAVRNGQEVDGLNPQTVESLLTAVNADPKMSAYVDKINELFDGNFKWNAKDINRPLGGEIAGVADKVKRAEFISDYLNNAEQIFSEANLNKIEATAGKEVRDNLEKTLARMKSGKNRTISQDSSTNKLLDWVNNATAMIMFTNMRSAALQTLSIFNYINTGGNNVFQAAKNLANYGQYREDFKMLWNSPYLRGRRKSLAFDIAADEIADAAQSVEGYNNLMSKIRELGFKPTQIMDSFAISRGGALFYRTRLNKYKKEGHPNAEQAAMDDFIAITEESQQSADPARISQIQAGPLGRIVFAFGNTPFQYARVMKRAVQDLASGRGNPANHIARIAYYTGIQAMLFNTLQQALWMGDDEEDKEERKQWAITGAISSFFKSLGLGGAAVATAMSIAQESKKGNPNFVAAASSVSPPISAKLRQLDRAAKALKAENYLDASVKGTEAIFNVPTDRVMTKFNNLQQIVEGDLDGMQTLLKALGWSDYSLGIKDDEGRFSGSKFKNKSKFSKKSRFNKKSPFNRLENGEMGQAHRDGTIEVDPNLSPLEKAKTIAHEEQHVEDMKTRGLDYDENYVYWDNKRYARKNGKIRYNGNWHEEGASEFPWEKRAEAAEADASPLKNVDEDKKKKNPYQTIKETKQGYRDLTEAQAKKYGWEDKSNQDVKLLPVEGGTRGSIELGGRYYKPSYVGDVSEREEFEHGPEHFKAAREWTKDWESNPITIQKDIARTGASEEELHKALDRQRKATVKNSPKGEDLAATYDPRTHQIADNPNFRGGEGFGGESVMAHEFAHAGRDVERGLHVKDVIGSIPIAEFNDPDGNYKEYVNRPHEMYGFLQQLRHDLGIKPGQSITPEQIKAAKKAGNKNPFLNVPVKKIIEANDKVADIGRKRPSLEDLYNV